MYVDKHGNAIPADAFENEPQVRPLPLDPAQRKKFDAETEALMKHKRK